LAYYTMTFILTYYTMTFILTYFGILYYDFYFDIFWHTTQSKPNILLDFYIFLNYVNS